MIDDDQSTILNMTILTGWKDDHHIPNNYKIQHTNKRKRNLSLLTKNINVNANLQTEFNDLDSSYDFDCPETNIDKFLNISIDNLQHPYENKLPVIALNKNG